MKPLATPATTGPNPARLLAGIVLVGALIWILGPARGGSTAYQAPANVTSGAEAPVTVSGSGIRNTAPFTLGGGNYTVSWTAQASSSSGCYHGASLKSTGGGYFELIGNEIYSDAASHTDSTILYGVPSGQYYVDASSGCIWTITFTKG